MYLAAGLYDLLILVIHNHNARPPFHPLQTLAIMEGGEGAHLHLPAGEISRGLYQLAARGLFCGKHHLLQLKRTKVRLRGGVTKPSIIRWEREEVKFWVCIPNETNVLCSGERGERGSLALLGGGWMLEPGQGRDVSGGRVPVLPHQGNQGGGVASLAEEGMVEQLNSTRSLCRISHQHLVKEAL